MKAGRELDALIFKHILTDVKISDFKISEDLYLIQDNEEPDYYVVCSPSKYIDDAWLVVEKMKELGNAIEILLIGNNVWVEIRSEIHVQNEDVKAETAPLAICLAALKAVGVEVDG